MPFTQMGRFLNFTAMESPRLLRNLILCISLIFHLAVKSQKTDSSSVDSDSGLAKSAFVIKLQKAGRDEAIRSIEKFKSGRIKIEREKALEALKQTTHDLKIFLEKGFDTGYVSKELERSNKNLEIVKDGIFTNTGTLQTQRNLSVSSAILTELLAGMNGHKTALTNYTNTLIGFRDKIDSINSIEALYDFPSDSVETRRYFNKLVVIVKEIAPPDSALDRALGSVEELQTRVDEHVFDLKSNLERIEKFSQFLTHNILNREVPGFMQPPGNYPMPKRRWHSVFIYGKIRHASCCCCC
jgi:potassium-dependent mechanosensitive channel